MQIVKIVLIVLFFLLGVYLFQIFSVHGVKQDISEYDGDGVIRGKGSGFFSKGFEIEFGKFDMGSPFNCTYRLSNLPNINKSHVFYLRVFSNQENNDKLKTLLSGNIRLKIQDSNYKSLFEAHSILSDWVKTSFNDGNTLDVYLFNESHSSIFPRDMFFSNPTYIEISYSPGKEYPRGKNYAEGFLRIGASK